MPDDVDVDQNSLVVNLIHYSVISNSDAPKVSRPPQLSAALRAWRFGEGFDPLQDPLGDIGG